MPTQPQYTPPESGRQLSAGMVGNLQRDVQSLYTQQTPDGFVVDISPFGTRLRDETRKPFPARITGDGSGSGSGSAFFDRYDWEEVTPLSDKTFITKVGGRRGTSDERPAVEANGREDVSVDTIVMLYPATTEWFFFLWCGDNEGSGSGGGIPIYCDGTLSGYVSVSGDSVSVTTV